MQDLHNKVALVTGVANHRSIAYAIAADLARHGCRLAVAYQPLPRDNMRDRIAKLTESLKPELLVPLDVTDEESIEAAFTSIEESFGGLQVLVHAIASSKREELGGRFSNISQDGFLFAQQVSAYSLIPLVRRARPLMSDGGSVITLTYIGSTRAATNYNVMGPAKAALDANVRYLARELGRERIRVNAISAGPIRTLSASGIKDFLDILHFAEEHSALGRTISTDEVAGAASFLASERASGITGQVIHVDGGYNIFA